MKCFYHPQQDALGICRACGKGLCGQCVVDLDRGLACRDRCEDSVKQLIAATDQQLRILPTAIASHRFNYHLYFLLGLAFIATAAMMAPLAVLPEAMWLDVLLVVVGVALCAVGLRLRRVDRVAVQKRPEEGLPS
jgi:hypothetical protein